MHLYWPLVSQVHSVQLVADPLPQRMPGIGQAAPSTHMVPPPPVMPPAPVVAPAPPPVAPPVPMGQGMHLYWPLVSQVHSVQLVADPLPQRMPGIEQAAPSTHMVPPPVMPPAPVVAPAPPPVVPPVPGGQGMPT